MDGIDRVSEPPESDNVNVGDARLSELERIVSAEPESPLFYELALIHFEMGRAGRAGGILRAGLKAHPHHMPARLLYGQCLLEKGRYPACAREMARIIQRDEDNVDAMRTLARALLASAQAEEAAVVLERALRIAPHDADLQHLQGEAVAAQVAIQSAERPDEPEIGVLEPDGNVIRLTDVADASAEEPAPAPGFTGYIRAIAVAPRRPEPSPAPADDWALPLETIPPLVNAPPMLAELQAAVAAQAVEFEPEVGSTLLPVGAIDAEAEAAAPAASVPVPPELATVSEPPEAPSVPGDDDPGDATRVLDVVDDSLDVPAEGAVSGGRPPGGVPIEPNGPPAETMEALPAPALEALPPVVAFPSPDDSDEEDATRAEDVPEHVLEARRHQPHPATGGTTREALSPGLRQGRASLSFTGVPERDPDADDDAGRPAPVGPPPPAREPGSLLLSALRVSAVPPAAPAAAPATSPSDTPPGSISVSLSSLPGSPRTGTPSLSTLPAPRPLPLPQPAPTPALAPAPATVAASPAKRQTPTVDARPRLALPRFDWEPESSGNLDWDPPAPLPASALSPTTPQAPVPGLHPAPITDISTRQDAPPSFQDLTGEMPALVPPVSIATDRGSLTEEIPRVEERPATVQLADPEPIDRPAPAQRPGTVRLARKGMHGAAAQSDEFQNSAEIPVPEPTPPPPTLAPPRHARAVVVDPEPAQASEPQIHTEDAVLESSAPRPAPRVRRAESSQPGAEPPRSSSPAPRPAASAKPQRVPVQAPAPSPAPVAKPAPDLLDLELDPDEFSDMPPKPAQLPHRAPPADLRDGDLSSEFQVPAPPVPKAPQKPQAAPPQKAPASPAKAAPRVIKPDRPPAHDMPADMMTPAPVSPRGAPAPDLRPVRGEAKAVSRAVPPASAAETEALDSVLSTAPLPGRGVPRAAQFDSVVDAELQPDDTGASRAAPVNSPAAPRERPAPAARPAPTGAAVPALRPSFPRPKARHLLPLALVALLLASLTITWRYRSVSNRYARALATAQQKTADGTWMGVQGAGQAVAEATAPADALARFGGFFVRAFGRPSLDARRADLLAYAARLEGERVTIFGEVERRDTLRQALEVAETVAPDRVDTALASAWQAIDAGQAAEARRSLETILQGRPLNAAPSASQTAEDAALHYTLGVAALQAGQTDAGVEHLRTALQLAPGHVGALKALADDRARRAEYRAATDAYRQILTSYSPTHLETRVALARLQIQLGKREAESLAELKTLSADPTLSGPQHALVFDALGAAALQRGDLPGARQAFTRAMQASPNDPRFAVGVAALDMRELKLDEAESMLVMAQRAHPENLETLRSLVEIRLLRGDPEGALRRLSVSPTLDARLLMQKGRALLEMGDGRAAEAALATAHDEDGDSKDIRIYHALAVYRVARTTQNLEALKGLRALPVGDERLEDRALPFRALGEALGAAGDHKGATAAYQQAMETDNRDFLASWGLCQLALSEGDTQRGLNHCRTAVQLNPHFLPAADRTAAIAEAREDDQSVIAVLAPLVARDPDHPVAVRRLARAYLRTGDPSHASHLVEGEHASADPPTRHYILGLVAATENHLPDALTDLAAAADALPSDPFVLEAHADLLMRDGKPDQAGAVYRRAVAAGGGASAGIGAARASMLTERWADAAIAAQAAQERAEKDRAPMATQAQALALQAAAALAQGDVAGRQRAAALVDRAISVAPDEPTARLTAGRLAEAEGRTAEAVEHFRRATVAQPNSAEARYYLGRAMLSTPNQRSAGRDVLEQATRLDPQGRFGALADQLLRKAP